ncbi:U1 small nuclear ribonucleoprotein A isoform X2 [Cucurbita maxima]|uniref:U1 small nuclear ribonucleoprotein A isoform X2 n=1 Tax=Cucurbita maxima TaxID=3661 RepID=A0A6J1IMS7_CUCMA|nr:U1 small nuclear ribonucleoprotein A isoform X2 [Cucurbita maxima]
MDDITSYYAPPPQPQPPSQPSGLEAPHYPYYQVPPPPSSAPSSQHYLAQHPPTFASYGLPFLPHAASINEVRTLFIAGLPEDVKPREIYNLFREFPGYESSHLRSPTQTTQPFAFAVFSDQQSAVGAMHAVNGMVFDLEKQSVLYVDLAKSNSRSKRMRTEDERYGSDKKAKVSIFSRRTPDPAGLGSTHMSGMGNSAYNTIGYPSAQSHGSFDNKTVNDTVAANVTPQNPPCPTLFVANLGPSCTEQELIQIFSRCPGFLKLKMQSTYGAPVAFVDFQDTACSTGALNHLQGSILYSSPPGEGMRLEYAKSRMGMRKKLK